MQQSLLALLNAVLYGAVVVIIVWRHLADSRALKFQNWCLTASQMATAATVVVAVVSGFMWRGKESLHALAFGIEPFQLVRVEYGLAGAGQIAKQRIYFIWDPGWVPTAELATN